MLLHWVAIGSSIVALLMALTLSTALALLGGLAWDVLFGLVPNGFGLCRGWSEEEAARAQEQLLDPKDQPTDPKDEPSHVNGKHSSAKDTDLAGFLHFGIQTAAGRKVTDLPLTFKDLWDAPGAGPTRSATRAVNTLDARSISRSTPPILRTAGPIAFHSKQPTTWGACFSRSSRWRSIFRSRYCGICLHTRGPIVRKTVPIPTQSRIPRRYLELPREHLPIAVAARLALSFPLLISAVPLWAIDYEPKEKDERKLAECWLSDGGLCSNFPIHLFDSFLPKWPTFGFRCRPAANIGSGRKRRGKKKRRMATQ